MENLDNPAEQQTPSAQEALPPSTAGRKAYWVVYDAALHDTFERDVAPLLKGVEHYGIAWDGEGELVIEADARVVTYLGDALLYRLVVQAREAHWMVGVLPHPQLLRGARFFFVPKKLDEAWNGIVECDTPVMSDLMTCNGRVAFGSVMVGNPLTMRPAAQIGSDLWSKLKHVYGLVMKLPQTFLLPYKIETAKQTVVNTAALGITAVYRLSGSEFTKRVVGEVAEDEASLNAVILAPRSLSEMVHFIFSRVLPSKVKSQPLNSYLGHIKTESMLLSSKKPMDYSIDGEMLTAETLKIEVVPDALAVLSSTLPPKTAAREGKESVKTVGLPKGQSINELIYRPLPWIHHADQDEVKETFLSLRENAQTSQAYLVLMVLSTLLATVGLFANSAPVIIGAMILAPLMAPIISLSMGVLRQSSDLVSNSSKTLGTGIFLALFCGTFLTWLMPLQSLNPEISARLSPTILDLGVAIISGIAGAYANARSEVAKSLAGVAIAVALVPPLAVSGIGIGWLDWAVFSGAFLLFATNLVGIVLAAAATFLVMGFSPFKLAKRGLLLSLAFVAVVSVPLVLSFDSMVKEQRMVYALEHWQCTQLPFPVTLQEVKIRGGEPLYISVKLLAPQALQAGQIDFIKTRMEDVIGVPIRLEATTAIVR